MAVGNSCVSKIKEINNESSVYEFIQLPAETTMLPALVGEENSNNRQFWEMEREDQQPSGRRRRSTRSARRKEREAVEGESSRGRKETAATVARRKQEKEKGVAAAVGKRKRGTRGVHVNSFTIFIFKFHDL